VGDGKDNIRIFYQGGVFGEIPAYGFFIRHVKGIEMNDVPVSYMKEDLRPAILVESVQGMDFRNLKAQPCGGRSGAGAEQCGFHDSPIAFHY